MARARVTIHLVNDTDRSFEIGARDLIFALIGADERPPPLAVVLEVPMDDGRAVSIGMPVDGSDEITATVNEPSP